MKHGEQCAVAAAEREWTRKRGGGWQVGLGGGVGWRCLSKIFHYHNGETFGGTLFQT